MTEEEAKNDLEIKNSMPTITLYQPWATWIIRGWKPIETRTHNRFMCLKGKWILIHAGKTTDANAINNPYLSKDQLAQSPEEIINGYILGAAFVSDFKALDKRHSKDALIDCGNVQRFGLFLNNVYRLMEPIPVLGEMGVWYFNLETKQKVKKPKSKSLLLF